MITIHTRGSARQDAPVADDSGEQDEMAPLLRILSGDEAESYQFVGIVVRRADETGATLTEPVEIHKYRKGQHYVYVDTEGRRYRFDATAGSYLLIEPRLRN